MLKASILLPFLLLFFLLFLLPISSPSTRRRSYTNEIHPSDRNFDTKSLQDLLKPKSDVQPRNIISSRDRNTKELLNRRITSTALFSRL